MFIHVKLNNDSDSPYILVNSDVIARVLAKERKVITLVLNDGTEIDIQSTFEEIFHVLNTVIVQSPKV